MQLQIACHRPLPWLISFSLDTSSPLPMKLDPVVNAIHHGIRDDITFALEHKRYRATLLLSFSAMDAMAFLEMPAKQSDVTRTDFINWTSRYIVFPGEEQLTGI